MNRKRIRHGILILVVSAAVFISSCGEGCNNNRSVYYTLSVLEPVNGTIAVDPFLPLYREGSIVYLTAAPADGFDLDTWAGDTDSRENPLPLLMDSDKTITAEFIRYGTTTYYVNFDSGSDADDGLSESTPWKHAPGDANAEGNAAACVPGPGTTVLFRGGVVYRGQIAIPSDGAFTHHVKYIGNAWPAGQKAVIDGGDVITGWTPCGSAEECNGSPNYDHLYYAHIPAEADPLSLNLHEDGAFLWPAQDPDPANPFFYDDRSDFRVIPQSSMTRTSITDGGYFTQDGPSDWDDSYLLVWVNPNIVVTRKILAYEPAAHRVTFDDLGEYAIYPDGRDQSYAVFNSPRALDRAGEYFAATATGAQGRKILLWPLSGSDPGPRITYSVRNYGFDINTRSNITIEGFEVRNHCGTGLRDGVGIGTISAAHIASYNLTIRNNYITHNRKGGSDAGYGGIFIGQCYGTLVEGNELVDNPRQAGIFFGSGARITARENIITRSGSTSLRMYGVHHGLMQGNTISDSNGSHANGITLYMGCRDILVAGNRVLDSGSPITFQDSGNLWFVNNLVDACGRDSNVNEWGDTSHGPWVRGVIAFYNNTLVRNNRNASLNIGDNPGENTYYSVNNIIDGGGNGRGIRRSHNIYTGLSWSQDEYYGWYPAEGEIVQEDLSLIFDDPAALVYSILTGGPAAGEGEDILPLLPVDLFPEYDFTADIDGNPRTGRDIGAFAD